MADLPSSPIIKMNDVEIANDAPITEDLMRKIGININGLIDRQGIVYQDFLANGTFIVPANVTHVWVFGCGGGGGGGRSSNGFGGQGGWGAIPTLFHVLVTPNSSIPVVIGAGGAGAQGATINGSDGGNTTFGSLITFYGAKGGFGGDIQFSIEGGGSVNGSNLMKILSPKNIGGLYAQGGWAGQNGASSPFAIGGQAFSSAQNNGGGGGAGLGAGANGANGSGLSASNNSGAGGAGGIDFFSAIGGNGGSGFLRVIWSNA